MSGYTNALLQTVGYSYNDAGQVVGVDYPAGTDTVIDYDGAGRADTLTDASGTSSWTYNAAGEVTLLDTPQGEISYLYNLAGQVTNMEVDGTDLTEYSYDAYGRFSSLTNPFAEVTSVTFDSAGRVSRKDLDSGVYETYSYDERSRPELILVKDSSNAEIDRKEYVWDAASRVTSAKEGGYWSYYEYDAIDQLIEEEKPGLSYLATYTYDANGNRLTRTVNSVTESYVYDEADKLETVSINSSVVKEFTYDAAGRTTAVETGAGTTSFAYDYEGRVTSITYPGSSSDSYTYNGIGARVSASGTSGSRSYLRNGLSVTAPVLSDGTADYTPGVSRRASSATRFSHSGLKNTNSQSNESETIAASRVYDAFGNVVSSSGSWSGPFGYAGDFGYQEDASGLRLLGHRYYDSGIGRFLVFDKAHDGTNWWRYAASNSITKCDPDGRIIQFVGALVAVGAVVLLVVGLKNILESGLKRQEEAEREYDRKVRHNIGMSPVLIEETEFEAGQDLVEETYDNFVETGATAVGHAMSTAPGPIPYTDGSVLGTAVGLATGVLNLPGASAEPPGSIFASDHYWTPGGSSIFGDSPFSKGYPLSWPGSKPPLVFKGHL